MSKFDLKPVLSVLGVIISCVGVLMLVPFLYAAFNAESTMVNLGLTSISLVLSGMVLYKLVPSKSKNLNKRQGYILVVTAWLGTAILSGLPYYFGGIGFDWSMAFFESMSGLTTTGATVIEDLERIPNSILLWRSLTQWLGGMGIIVLTIAIFPLLGLGGVNLFSAESPGPTSIKLHPRIKETAKRLWMIYVGLTLLLSLILWLEGMTLFNAINHSLTTIATGGFSTHNASLGHYDSPLIQYTVIIFMLVAGMNYSLIYLSLKGRFSKVLASQELKAYVGLVVFLVLIIAILMCFETTYGVEHAFRNALFHVVSLITTTGSVLEDLNWWHPFISFVFFSLLFCGASSGSTSGGIKIIRHLVLAKNALLEYKRMLHPNALLRVRLDNELVRPKIISNVLVFLLTYLLVFFIGTLLMITILPGFGFPLKEAASLVATSLGNVGPSLGKSYGPVNTFHEIPLIGKYVLSIIMLIGRLEVFTVLIILTPYFWREN